MCYKNQTLERLSNVWGHFLCWETLINFTWKYPKRHIAGPMAFNPSKTSYQAVFLSYPSSLVMRFLHIFKKKLCHASIRFFFFSFDNQLDFYILNFILSSFEMLPGRSPLLNQKDPEIIEADSIQVFLKCRLLV